MKEIIRSRLDENKSREDNIHSVGEFLQLLLLRIIHETNYFQYISFVGGTSLRLLYGLQRFSEDLDFSLINKKGYDFRYLIKSIVFHLEKTDLRIEHKSKEQKVVQNLYIKFTDILQQMNLARMHDEKLSIRIEIDRNPPQGWHNEMTLLNDFFIFPVWHFDLPSLFATKLHACFYRKYKKGRDYYDLMWYLSKKITPNFQLLNNAIKQTENVDLNINKNDFKTFLVNKLEPIDFSNIQRDAAPFLANKSELALIKKDVFVKLISQF